MSEQFPGSGFSDPVFHPDVSDFYLRHNRDQTLERARSLEARYRDRIVGRASVLERFDALADIRDASDGDLDGMSQLGHALQTTDSIRRARLGEDWIVSGLIHDLGKLLIEYGEASEFVVGDTFPLGCAFAPSIRHAQFLSENQDASEQAFQSPCGIYSEGCGLDAVTFTFGHDEYLWEVLHDRLPDEVAWVIRYHSFQSVAGDYPHLFDPRDRALRDSHMRVFARHDLYSKHPHAVSDEHLAEYRALLSRRFPDPVDW